MGRLTYKFLWSLVTGMTMAPTKALSLPISRKARTHTQSFVHEFRIRIVKLFSGESSGHARLREACLSACSDEACLSSTFNRDHFKACTDKVWSIREPRGQNAKEIEAAMRARCQRKIY